MKWDDWSEEALAGWIGAGILICSIAIGCAAGAVVWSIAKWLAR